MKSISLRFQYPLALAGLCVVLLVPYFAVSYHFFGPFVSAKFGLIDDHEILRFLGPNHVVRFWDIPRLLITKTEVGQWGTSSRLRPIYYILRLVETALWGDHAGLWYLTRIVLVALAAFGASLVVLRALLRRNSSRGRQLVAILLAIFIGVLVLTIPAWTDIATRLGPSEIYVGIGLVVLAFGAVDVWIVPELRRGWIIACAGFLLVLGSKEDGVMFIVPLAALYIARGPGNAPRWTLIVTGVLSLLSTGYVAMGVTIAAARAGSDIYGNSLSVSRFFSLDVNNEYLLIAIVLFVVATICDATSIQTLRSRDTGTRIELISARVSRWPHTAVAVVALYLVLGETFFYQNYFQTSAFPSGAGGRYGFVTQLAVAASVISALAALTGLRVARRRTRVAALLCAVAYLVASPIAAQVRGVQREHTTSLAAATTTANIYNEILRGVADVNDHPGSEVIVLVDKPADYEPLYSLPEFLAYYGKHDGVFANVQISSVDAGVSALTMHETTLLKMIARDGRTTGGWRVFPIADLDPSKRLVCFSIGKRATGQGEHCSSFHQIGPQ